MTTIIGIQNADGCSIYADSQTTAGDRPYLHRDLAKIIERNGYYLACAGSARASDVVNWLWLPPHCNVIDNDELYEHMLVSVIPSLRNALVLNGFPVDASNEEDFTMLVAIRGCLFEVASDFSVLQRHDGYYGVGTGYPYAIGALCSLATPLEAMRIAISNDIYSGGEIQAVFQEKNYD